MSLHINSDNIIDIHKGNQKIARVYKGSSLVWGYHPGEVIFESQRDGTHTINIKCNCKIIVEVVGAGGGGASAYDQPKYYYKSGAAGGGSGGYIKGQMSINAGTYTATIGTGGNAASGAWENQAGTGSSSSFGSYLTANGGAGGYARWTDGSPSDCRAGAGGTTSSSQGVTVITNTNGNDGTIFNHGYDRAYGGASVHDGYGKGGDGQASGGTTDAGGSGYIKITAV